jgi:hypothetical protein
MEQKEKPSLQKYLNKRGKMPDLEVWSAKFKLQYVINTKENKTKGKKGTHAHHPSTILNLHGNLEKWENAWMTLHPDFPLCINVDTIAHFQRNYDF